MLGVFGGLRFCRGASTRISPSNILPVLRYHSRMATRPLDFHDGPLVWVDCEMTGLDPRKDKIIEIAVLITNGNLELVDPGIQYVIKTDKKLLDGMDEWCTEQHGRSGLTKSCIESPHTMEFVTGQALAYIKKWIPTPRIGVLAGNSVHADRVFLASDMPDIVEHLHYRIVDVSSIKELSRRWYAQQGIPPKVSESNHRALDDIRGSIKELQWYRQNIFISPPTSLREPRSLFPPPP
ncbi:ribonuclease H-like domain-containing protein [Crassisporium funariophilum]|nr:ribonuclease H-like domain-containing protein [Crassisporium funariophilum]